ncbi:MAG TPA: YetF domain-containing protein [Gemmataceae bacterium]|nr:YetF domain-containing protein [Gemmataceae bacterium]
MSLLIVVGQTLAIYVFLVIILSRLGRSLMAGLTYSNYLVVALLGSAVETGLYHGSSALSAGLVSAGTLILANLITSALMNRWPRLRRLLAGAPVVLVHDGQLLPGRLRQVRLTEQEVRTAIRKRGYDKLSDVRLAVIEQNGEIGVVPRTRRDRR